MTRPQAPTVRFLLTMMLAFLLPAARGEEFIEAQIQVAQVSADSVRRPGPEVFTLKYDVRLTNDSEKAVNIPDPIPNPASMSWITLLAMESEQADGSWKFIVNPGMLSFKPDTQFFPCKMLLPNQTKEFKGVAGQFVLFDSQLAHFQGNQTVRVGLVLTCRQLDGSLSSSSVETAPFSLRLPDRP